jgi:hypothetical protein
MAEDISGGIAANFETRIAHKSHHIYVRGEIGVRKAEAGDAAIGVSAELAKSFEILLQTRRLDMRRGRGLQLRTAAARDRRKQRRNKKCETACHEWDRSKVHSRLPLWRRGYTGAKTIARAVCRVCGFSLE